MIVPRQDPNTFVCATTKAEVANELVKISPLAFKFVSEPLQSVRARASPGVYAVDVAAPIEIHEVKDDDPDLAQPPAPESISDPIKTFTVHINPSQSYYSHKEQIRLNPIHGPWPRTLREDQDFIYFALKKVIPNNFALQGLCDWHTGGQLSEAAKHLRMAKAGGKLWHIHQRQLRRENRSTANNGTGDELVTWTSLDEDTRRRDAEWERAVGVLEDQAGTRTGPKSLPFDGTLESMSEPQQSAAETVHSKAAQLEEKAAAEGVAAVPDPKNPTTEPRVARPKPQDVRVDGRNRSAPKAALAEERTGLAKSPRRPTTKTRPRKTGDAGWDVRKRTILDPSVLRVHYWARDRIPVKGPVMWKSIPLCKDVVDDQPFRLESFRTEFGWKTILTKQDESDSRPPSKADDER